MAIPREAREAAAAHVEIFCANQIPQHAKDEVRLEHSVRGGSITISSVGHRGSRSTVRSGRA